MGLSDQTSKRQMLQADCSVQIDRQAGRQTDGQSPTDRQKDRQMGKHTEPADYFVIRVFDMKFPADRFRIQ